MKIYLIKNLFKVISLISSDKNAKSLSRIILDMIKLFFRHKSFPTHYFSRFLFVNDGRNIFDFVPNKILYSLDKKFNNPDFTYYLDNKIVYENFFKNHNIPVIKILFFNYKNIFIVEGNWFRINNSDEFFRFIKDYFQQYNCQNSIFIKKSYDSWGGKNIYRIGKDNFNEMISEEIYSNVIKSSYIFQETIAQHKLINDINPSCINTLRMDTFYDSEGQSNILSCFMRFGVNDSIVDNISSGGMFVGVDLNTGKLKKHGYTSISISGGHIMKEHPISGIIFEDYQLPFFQEIKGYVIKISSLVPWIRIVGWDIAITPDGPVIIEGNAGHAIASNDLVANGFYTNDNFNKILTEMKKGENRKTFYNV